MKYIRRSCLSLWQLFAVRWILSSEEGSCWTKKKKKKNEVSLSKMNFAQTVIHGKLLYNSVLLEIHDNKIRYVDRPLNFDLNEEVHKISSKIAHVWIYMNIHILSICMNELIIWQRNDFSMKTSFRNKSPNQESIPKQCY